MDFTDKICLITGGSSGIGLALAKELAGRGATVVLAARREAELEQALAALPTSGQGQRFAIPCDVSDRKQVKNLVAETVAKAGPVDILINSAGVVMPGYVQELELDTFKWMMEVNYFGTVNTVQMVLPSMLARGSGVIVNIASFVAYVGIFGYAAYSGSKFAVRGYTEALRMEMKPHGIQVCLVAPPDTDTPQLAFENQYKPPELKALLPELGVLPPEQVARAVLRGIERQKFEIFPDFGASLLIGIIRHTGALYLSILDLLLRRAQKNNPKNNHGIGERQS